MPVIDNEDCADAYVNETQYVIEDTMICVGDLENGGVDTCDGDDGGPFVKVDSAPGGGDILAGVGGWGLGCGRPGNPTIITRITSYLDWINDTIERHS